MIESLYHVCRRFLHLQENWDCQSDGRLHTAYSEPLRTGARDRVTSRDARDVFTTCASAYMIFRSIALYLSIPPVALILH
jgi:hypothetical protein